MQRKGFKLQKIISMWLCAVLAISLAACGKEVPGSLEKSAETGEATETVPETQTKESAVEGMAETKETAETDAGSEQEAAEPIGETAESATEQVTDNRLDEGIAKVYKGIQAYNDLVSHGGILNETLQDLVENIEPEKYDLDHPVTKDGYPIQTAMRVNGALINYYWSYINEDSGYYDIEEWISNQENDDALFASKICDWTGDLTNNACMMEFIGLMNFMNQCSQIVGTDVIEADENTPIGNFKTKDNKLEKQRQ